MSLVSIIVPVYGVEKYLNECVESLLAQTYPKLEIILVDDASPDACGVLCDEFAAQDSRVKVIHKSNGGAASARNMGIAAATGEFICFVDSDDVVASNYVECLLKHLTEGQADISVCGFTQFTKVGKEQFSACEPCGTYDSHAYLAQFLKSWTCALLWNKMFRREAIGQIRMAEGHRIDDEFFTYQVVLNAKKVIVFDAPLYHYRLRRSGVMQTNSAAGEQITLDRIDYIQQRYSHICQYAPELQSAFFADMVDSFARLWADCAGAPEVKHQVSLWKSKNLWRILTSKSSLKWKAIYVRALYLQRPRDINNTSSLKVSNDNLFE